MAWRLCRAAILRMICRLLIEDIRGRRVSESQVDQAVVEDQNEQIEQRKRKLAGLREQGQAYLSGFEREHYAGDCHQSYDDWDKEKLEAEAITVTVAGRMMTRRVMGKASFATIQDMSGRIQLYITRDGLPEGLYAQFKTWDLGDIVGASGVLFKTKTGELSVQVSALTLLTKALRPLPDKYHGLVDQEQRYRQRYLDLITNADSRGVFEARSRLVSEMRRFLDSHRFMEVETPILMKSTLSFLQISIAFFENGEIPIQGVPSPPICVKNSVPSTESTAI